MLTVPSKTCPHRPTDGTVSFIGDGYGHVDGAGLEDGDEGVEEVGIEDHIVIAFYIKGHVKDFKHIEGNETRIKDRKCYQEPGEKAL